MNLLRSFALNQLRYWKLCLLQHRHIFQPSSYRAPVAVCTNTGIAFERGYKVGKSCFSVTPSRVAACSAICCPAYIVRTLIATTATTPVIMRTCRVRTRLPTPPPTHISTLKLNCIRCILQHTARAVEPPLTWPSRQHMLADCCWCHAACISHSPRNECGHPACT